MREIKEDVQRTGLAAPIVSHAADGNVHALIMFKTEEERERAMGIVHRMVERAQRLDGTCTGEHGGLVLRRQEPLIECAQALGSVSAFQARDDTGSPTTGKSKYLETELGKGTVRVLRQIKETLDPLNIMNVSGIAKVLRH
jgi:D-lactate dehydrogenase (cytochrome)